ncbi:MAG: GTPase [archaeon]
MASTNQSPHFIKAQGEYLNAETKEQKIKALKKMISLAPSHKGAENLRADLKRRLAKLKYAYEKESKKAKSSKIGIKKAEMQAVLIGLANSGKSSILNILTNAHPEIAHYKYTTKQPILGTLNYEGVKIQLIDMPAIENEMFDQGLANTADLLLIVIEKIPDIEKIESFLEKTKGKKIYIFAKIDLLDNNEIRKAEATLKSKKKEFVLFSAKTQENLLNLKEKIFLSFGKIRIYTKEPGKSYDSEPVIIPINSSVKQVADKIFHGLSSQIKETRVTGPSSKFPNQKVGLSHILKDKDIVEFHKK